MAVFGTLLGIVLFIGYFWLELPRRRGSRHGSPAERQPDAKRAFRRGVAVATPANAWLLVLSGRCRV